MSIREMKANGTITMHCVACTHDFDVTPSEVEIGRARPGSKMAAADPEPPPILEPDTMIMPPCPNCQATTQYQVNFDVCPERHVGTAFDLRRRAVNAYWKKLRQLGRQNAHCKAKIDAKSDPPDLMNANKVKNMPIAVKRKHRVS